MESSFKEAFARSCSPDRSVTEPFGSQNRAKRRSTLSRNRARLASVDASIR